MFKYLNLFLFIFFLRGMEPVYSQSSGDSVETLDINPYSLYRLKARSGHLHMDSVREVDKNQVKSFLLNPDYAYANDPEYWKEEKPSNNPGFFFRLLSGKLLRWIIFLGMIAVVLFGIYQLAKENNFRWLTRSGGQINSGSQESPQDDAVDYDEAIRKYQLEGNYRLAVRYLYLRLIRTAREKAGIQFRDSSTNAEITRAFGTHARAAEFRFLATAYEYIFYGGFIPKQDLIDMLKNKFETFQQTLSV
jgi:hypothetical protein